MRFNLFLAIFGLLFSVGADWYLCRRLSFLRNLNRYLRYHVELLTVCQYVALLTAVFIPIKSASDTLFTVTMWLIFIFISVFFSKLALLLGDSVCRLYRKIRRLPGKSVTPGAWIFSGCIFIALWWGALINRNRISVVECHLYFHDLPAAFDGYRVVQISDFHVSAWGSDTSFVSRVVDKINKMEPDLILFTGDIVTRRSTELEPMVAPLSRLRAKDGLYAVLGNHDYGDYMQWESDSAHLADRLNLKRLYGATPFRLLNNETDYIHHGEDSIAIIGVENIAEPPFITYGDLDRAYDDLSDGVFKILLSHNPRHWTNDIENDAAKNIALTLSGHTHAMQIQIGGHSPAALKYPTDWGVYEDSLGHFLYVNRGLGTVGFPMRLGATPEITLFTLSSR